MSTSVTRKRRLPIPRTCVRHLGQAQWAFGEAEAHCSNTLGVSVGLLIGCAGDDNPPDDYDQAAERLPGRFEAKRVRRLEIA